MFKHVAPPQKITLNSGELYHNKRPVTIDINIVALGGILMFSTFYLRKSLQ